MLVYLFKAIPGRTGGDNCHFIHPYYSFFRNFNARGEKTQVKKAVNAMTL